MYYTPSRSMFFLIRIAGYTWYKTYRTIEMLAGSPSTATTRWLEHKQTELNFASLIVSPLAGAVEIRGADGVTTLQGGLLASCVTASLSWPDVPTAHWLVRACWYVSLSMVITSVLVAFQQVAGLGGILATHGSHASLYSALLDRNGRPDIKIVFVLQVPVQLLSYSIFFYTLGLAVHVISPLGWSVWGDGSKVRCPLRRLLRKVLMREDCRVLLRRSRRLCLAVHDRQPLQPAVAGYVEFGRETERGYGERAWRQRGELLEEANVHE